MRIPQYVVNAFTDRPFAGNPAAVCVLDRWLPDETLQAIAAQNNLSETAFFLAESDGEDGARRLRWFTPANEVDLCGHATLASAWVLLNELGLSDELLRFDSLSGRLVVARTEGGLRLDFPSRPPAPAAPPEGLLEALGGTPLEVVKARSYLVRYGSAAEVRALTPDLAAIEALDLFGVIVSAPGDDTEEPCDFASRFFAPSQGVPEDPVCGSAHCTLTPYWAARLGRERLLARHLSARGGWIRCELRGERVWLTGRAVTWSDGHVTLQG